MRAIGPSPHAQHVEGSGWLNAIDYHVALLHYPAGMGKNFRANGDRGSRPALQRSPPLPCGRVRRGARTCHCCKCSNLHAPAQRGRRAALCGDGAIELLGADDKYLMYGITFGETPTLSVGGHTISSATPRASRTASATTRSSAGYLLDYRFPRTTKSSPRAPSRIGARAPTTWHRPRGVGRPAFACVFEPVVGFDWFARSTRWMTITPHERAAIFGFASTHQRQGRNGLHRR